LASAARAAEEPAPGDDLWLERQCMAGRAAPDAIRQVEPLLVAVFPSTDQRVAPPQPPHPTHERGRRRPHGPHAPGTVAIAGSAPPLFDSR
jgi:hypothetical protein